ncbi:hypothetical protein ASG11_14560 [Sphingomonas sp. Leaf357]|nr:hypothetical protein ASG11_14560 [Sphingomonas sp. Leaf357]
MMHEMFTDLCQSIDRQARRDRQPVPSMKFVPVFLCGEDAVDQRPGRRASLTTPYFTATISPRTDIKAQDIATCRY